MRIIAPYRLVILKRRFPASTGKTIVRKLLKCIVLTIVDSDVLKDDSQKHLWTHDTGKEWWNLPLRL